MTFRDEFGTISQDEDYTALLPLWGQPGLPPWRLALVIIVYRIPKAYKEGTECECGAHILVGGGLA